jgi:hypothetical protein
MKGISTGGMGMALGPTPNPAHLNLDADLQRRIEEYAHASGVPPSEVVRRAFDEFVAAHNGTDVKDDSLFDVLDRAGLIGCADSDLPTDLSTNPAHLEGFGRD